jgi:hypothetical protein
MIICSKCGMRYTEPLKELEEYIAKEKQRYGLVMYYLTIDGGLPYMYGLYKDGKVYITEGIDGDCEQIEISDEDEEDDDEDEDEYAKGEKDFDRITDEAIERTGCRGADEDEYAQRWLELHWLDCKGEGTGDACDCDNEEECDCEYEYDEEEAAERRAERRAEEEAREKWQREHPPCIWQRQCALCDKHYDCKAVIFDKKRKQLKVAAEDCEMLKRNPGSKGYYVWAEDVDREGIEILG